MVGKRKVDYKVQAVINSPPSRAACYKCGHVGTPTRRAGTIGAIDMVMMTYGKHRGEFFCKDRKECAARKRRKSK